MTRSFGTTNWDEETNRRGKGGNGDKKTEFLKLEEGSNIVRVVTKPHGYEVHKIKEEGDDGFGERVMCSAPLHNGACAACEHARSDKRKDFFPKRRYYIGVIDRKTGQYRILDIPSTVYNKIKALKDEEDYGDPIKYDIDIKVNKKASPTEYYNVLPKLPKPLTEADLALRAAADEKALNERCTPPTPDWVLSKVNTYREKMSMPAWEKSAPKTTVVAPTPVDTSGDEDVTFPVANGLDT